MAQDYNRYEIFDKTKVKRWIKKGGPKWGLQLYDNYVASPYMGLLRQSFMDPALLETLGTLEPNAFDGGCKALVESPEGSFIADNGLLDTRLQLETSSADVKSCRLLWHEKSKSVVAVSVDLWELMSQDVFFYLGASGGVFRVFVRHSSVPDPVAVMGAYNIGTDPFAFLKKE